MLAQEIEQRRVAKVLFKVCATGPGPPRRFPEPAIHAAENAGKIQGTLYFPHDPAPECRPRSGPRPLRRDNHTARATKLALKRLHFVRGKTVVLFEKLLKSFHEGRSKE